LDKTCSASVKILMDFSDSVTTQELTSKMLKDKLETTSRRLLGTKPGGLPPELDAQSAWATIAAIASSKMERLDNAVAGGRLRGLSEQAASDVKGECWKKVCSQCQSAG
jgi:hypothetical protein